MVLIYYTFLASLRLYLLLIPPLHCAQRTLIILGSTRLACSLSPPPPLLSSLTLIIFTNARSTFSNALFVMIVSWFFRVHAFDVYRCLRFRIPYANLLHFPAEARDFCHELGIWMPTPDAAGDALGFAPATHTGGDPPSATDLVPEDEDAQLAAAQRESFRFEYLCQKRACASAASASTSTDPAPGANPSPDLHYATLLSRFDALKVRLDSQDHQIAEMGTRLNARLDSLSTYQQQMFEALQRSLADLAATHPPSSTFPS